MSSFPSHFGLSLPRPAAQGFAAPPPVASSSSSPFSTSPPSTHPYRPHHPPHQGHRVPPPNFSTPEGIRNAARLSRQQKATPFVQPKPRNGLPRGKERDLTCCSVDELTELLERNTRLLETPEITASLPGGDGRIRSLQSRLLSRLKEIQDVDKIKDDLDRTHLDEAVKLEQGLPSLKLEDEEETMDVVDTPLSSSVASTSTLPLSSPTAKQRLAIRIQQSSPNSLTTTMSLAESLERQRLAAAREREASLVREAQREVRAKRPKNVGHLLQGAMKAAPDMANFMFQMDEEGSDEEEEEEGSLFQDDEEGEGPGGPGEMEELDELNPMRAAYLEGYHRAEKEEQAEMAARGGAKVS